MGIAPSIVLIGFHKSSMPARDSIHIFIKQALLKAGWRVTHDPYIISYGERFLFVDLGVEAWLLSAERSGKKIAIEIKDFRNKSVITSLEQAIGQYMLYQVLIQRVEPEREVYLAIPEKVYNEIFSEPIGQAVITDLSLKLIVVDLDKLEIVQWIPNNSVTL